MFSTFAKFLRVRSHERRNELKPVWDFISVENLTSVFSQLFTCVHMNWGEMKLKTVWISYWSFWPKLNFKPAWDFHVNILHETKWISADSCHFDRNEVSFLVIKYVNTIRNEMSAHVHQNIGSFWKAAEIKLHVNKTCFHAGLKSQTGMSSFRLSCEHALKTPFLTEYLQWRLLVLFTKSNKHSDALIGVLEKCCSGNFRKTNIFF